MTTIASSSSPPDGIAQAILAADGTLFFFVTDGSVDGEGGGFGTVNAQNVLSGTVMPDGIVVGSLDPINQTISGTYKLGSDTLGTFLLSYTPEIPVEATGAPLIAERIKDFPQSVASSITTPDTTAKGVDTAPLESSSTFSMPGQNRIVESRVLPDGRFHLMFSGESRSYVIEFSTDLTNWDALSTNQVNGVGLLEFTDPSSTNRPHGFFRVRTQQ